MFSATTYRPSAVSRNSGKCWNGFVASKPSGGCPLIVSHFRSKKPAKRRNALRTSTPISCPSPVRCRQSAATATALAARPIAAMLPKRKGLGLNRFGEQIRLGIFHGQNRLRLFCPQGGRDIHLLTPFQLDGVGCPQAAPLLGCDFVRGGRLRTLAQLDQAEQNLVPLRFQLRDGARSDLRMDAVDELLLHLGRQYRRTQRLPPGRHRTAELLEEVLDAARTAAEVIEHQVAHHSPAQAGAPGEGGVDVGGSPRPRRQ